MESPVSDNGGHMKSLVLGFLAASLSLTAAFAAEPAKTMETSIGKVYTDQNGMTLYTFDKDTVGASMSACTGKCIQNWPAFVAEEGAMADGDWTIVEFTDTDGSVKKTWAYEGSPLYLFVKDTKPGEVTGDGVNEVWHAAKAE
jgi:predicted lipoprotein with Yx(FWY)xxD motif